MNNLGKLIKKSNKTLRVLEEESGISIGTLSRIANGKQVNISLKTAFKLADALAVDINEFRKDE